VYIQYIGPNAADYRRGRRDCCTVFEVRMNGLTVGYNEFEFFFENEEHRPLDGCKIENLRHIN
jgi:hypothetical protein